MHEANLVGIHETWIAHHVAAISEVDRENCAPSVADRAMAVIVKRFIAVRSYVAARKNCFEMPQKLWINRNYVFKVTVRRAILNHKDSAVSLEDRGLDFAYAFSLEDRDIFA